AGDRRGPHPRRRGPRRGRPVRRAAAGRDEHRRCAPVRGVPAHHPGHGHHPHKDLLSASVLSVVGARPNFMKLAPVARALTARGVRHVVVHTGQHYDPEMSDAFFRDLSLPRPDYALGVGSGSHARQTAAIMDRFEPICEAAAPEVVLVYGDVNSTAAAALVAAKLGIAVGHVEAGLRSRDRTMPEEINRLVTD